MGWMGVVLGWQPLHHTTPTLLLSLHTVANYSRFCRLLIIRNFPAFICQHVGSHRSRSLFSQWYEIQVQEGRPFILRRDKILSDMNMDIPECQFEHYVFEMMPQENKVWFEIQKSFVNVSTLTGKKQVRKAIVNTSRQIFEYFEGGKHCCNSSDFHTKKLNSKKVFEMKKTQKQLRIMFRKPIA